MHFGLGATFIRPQKYLEGETREREKKKQLLCVLCRYIMSVRTVARSHSLIAMTKTQENKQIHCTYSTPPLNWCLSNCGGETRA